MRPRLRRLLPLSPLLVGVILPACMRGPAFERPPVFGPPPAPIEADALTVMTLNLAHGRGDGAHQALRSRAQIRAQLGEVARVIDREQPHVVALQEADGPSAWSGRFDHVAALVGMTRLAQGVRAENVRGAGIRYGAALAARGPLSDASAHTFAPSWPTFSKGFVRATLRWPAAPGGAIDVVSVHLDFASAAARRRQIDTLIEALRGAERPLVVMGDFNCDWWAADCPLRALSAALDLRPAAPEDPRATFPTLDSRIDWILVSPSLAVRDYAVLPDVVSDHRAVVARLEVAR